MEIEFNEKLNGMVLTLENNEKIDKKCNWCFKKIDIPFSFCLSTKKVFCKECELSSPKRLCGDYREMEHEHLNIVKIIKK